MCVLEELQEAVVAEGKVGMRPQRSPPAATAGSHQRKRSKLGAFWEDLSGCHGRTDWKEPEWLWGDPGGGCGVVLASAWGSGFWREGEGAQ